MWFLHRLFLLHEKEEQTVEEAHRPFGRSRRTIWILSMQIRRARASACVRPPPSIAR